MHIHVHGYQLQVEIRSSPLLRNPIVLMLGIRKGCYAAAVSSRLFSAGHSITVTMAFIPVHLIKFCTTNYYYSNEMQFCT